MRICASCVLPEVFPGVQFNAEGVCNHCQKFDRRIEKLTDEKKKSKQKFLELLNQHVNKPRLKGSKRPYDVILPYNGGKNSTYTLCLLRNKYRVRVLALTMDNNFLSLSALRNIRAVTDELDVDHLFLKPAWKHLKRIFSAGADRELYPKKVAERSSTICTSCRGMARSLCFKTAIEMDIPLLAFGCSPGDASLETAITKNDVSLIRSAQQTIRKPLKDVAGSEIETYFLNEMHYRNTEKLPHTVHPLAWEPYSESAILDEIKKTGWLPPDGDNTSPNCLLNAFANDVHIKRYGFHPDSWKIANLVREGSMAREEGWKKIYGEQQNQDFISAAQKKLSD